MGVVSPIGNDVEQVWDSVQHARCGIGEITHFDASDFRAKLAGEVKIWIWSSISQSGI